MDLRKQLCITIITFSTNSVLKILHAGTNMLQFPFFSKLKGDVLQRAGRTVICLRDGVKLILVI